MNSFVFIFSAKLSSNFKKYSIDKRQLYPPLELDKYKEKYLSKEKSHSCKYIPINIRGYPNIKRTIRLLKFEFLSNIDIKHIIFDQQNKAYNDKYNFIVNPFE